MLERTPLNNLKRHNAARMKQFIKRFFGAPSTKKCPTPETAMGFSTPKADAEGNACLNWSSHNRVAKTAKSTIYLASRCAARVADRDSHIVCGPCSGAHCRRDNKADKTKGDEVSARLVGTVLISNAMMHAYSEYGEGNFYGLRKLEKTGRNSWRAGVAVGIDTSPELSQPVDETLTMRLAANGRLIVASKPPPLNIESSWQVSYSLRRCADLPNGMSGNAAE